MWWVKYIGIPFAELGRGLSACDCWGLVRLVYEREKGVCLPSWAGHEGIKDFEAITREMEEARGFFRQVETPEPFALALFRSTQTVLHVGLLLDRQLMLHTTLGKDACVEPWKAYVHQLKGFYVPYDQDRRPPQPA